MIGPVSNNRDRHQPKRRSPRHLIHSGNVTKLLWATALVSSKPWLLKELLWLFDLAKWGLAAQMLNPDALDEQAVREAESTNRKNDKRLERLREVLNRLSSVVE